MFETSQPNGAAIALFARGRAPALRQFAQHRFRQADPELHRRRQIPADAAGRCSTSRIIGNETRYHSPGDTIAALDRASLDACRQRSSGRRPAPCPPCRIPPRRLGPHRSSPTSPGRAFIRLPLVGRGGRAGAAAVAAVSLPGAARRSAGRCCSRAGMLFGGMLVAGLVTLVAGLFRAGDFWRAYPLVAYLAIYAGCSRRWRRLVALRRGTSASGCAPRRGC